MGRRTRILGSAAILFGLTAACGAGAEEEETTAEHSLEETAESSTAVDEPTAAPVPTAQALRGCWDGPNGFYECYNEGGVYIYAQQDGVPATGTFRQPAENQLELTLGTDVARWAITSVDAITLTLTEAGTNRVIAYTRRPDVPATPDQIVGCWRRTTGGATECYSADRTWATRRTAGVGTTGAEPTTGTWRLLSPTRLELTIRGATNAYGMVWMGHDRITFIASDAREEFVRVAE